MAAPTSARTSRTRCAATCCSRANALHTPDRHLNPQDPPHDRRLTNNRQLKTSLEPRRGPPAARAGGAREATGRASSSGRRRERQVGREQPCEQSLTPKLRTRRSDPRAREAGQILHDLAIGARPRARRGKTREELRGRGARAAGVAAAEEKMRVVVALPKVTPFARAVDLRAVEPLAVAAVEVASPSSAPPHSGTRSSTPLSDSRQRSRSSRTPPLHPRVRRPARAAAAQLVERLLEAPARCRKQRAAAGRAPRRNRRCGGSAQTTARGQLSHDEAARRTPPARAAASSRPKNAKDRPAHFEPRVTSNLGGPLRLPVTDTHKSGAAELAARARSRPRLRLTRRAGGEPQLRVGRDVERRGVATCAARVEPPRGRGLAALLVARFRRLGRPAASPTPRARSARRPAAPAPRRRPPPRWRALPAAARAAATRQPVAQSTRSVAVASAGSAPRRGRQDGGERRLYAAAREPGGVGACDGGARRGVADACACKIAQPARAEHPGAVADQEVVAAHPRGRRRAYSPW